MKKSKKTIIDEMESIYNQALANQIIEETEKKIKEELIKKYGDNCKFYLENKHKYNLDA